MSTSIRILDADGKKPEFAQWDLDRVLVVSGCSTRPNVRFESGWFPPAIEIESVAAGENFQVIVPNFLLQNPGPLKISVIDQGTEFKALKTIVAQVSPGKKPLDYWDTQEIEEIMRDGQPGQVMTKVGTEKYAIRWGFPAVINMTQTTVDGHPVYSITYKETGTGEDIVTYGMVYPASQLYRKDETYSRSEAYSKSEVDTALDGAVISRNNITAGSGDFRDSLSKPGMYFKFSGEVPGGVNSHSARILLFRSPNDEYGKFLVWVDGVTGSVYTCVYRGPATGVWSDWVQIPSMGEVETAVAAKYSKPSGGIPASDLASAVQTSLGKADTAYQKPSGGIPASDLTEAVHNVIRNAVGSKPTYAIKIDTENGNAVTGPNYKWIVVSSLGGEPEVGAEFRIETVADGEITWSSTESVKYQVSGSYSVVIIGWRDRSELEGNPAGISGITRRYYAVSATISGNSVVYSYLGSFSSDLALMDDVAVRSFSKTSVDGHYVFNIGYLESGPLGDMETTGTIYPATETYRKDEVDAALAAKLDQNQGSGSAGKVMKVGSDGTLAPAAPAVRSFSKSVVGGHEVFSVGYGVSGPMGEMETTGSILPATETYRKDEVDTALAGKLDTDGDAYRAASIPMGHLDSTSTATVMTAQVDGITELRDGVCVWLTNGVVASASGVTLNINALGAKPIYNSLSGAIVTTTFTAASTYLFVYNSTRVTGGCWDMVYGYDANTTYTPVKLGFGYATCSTAEATAAKTAALSSYTLTTGGIVAVKFTNAVPAGATLNINSKGAKAIYYKGAAITAGVIKAGDTVTMIYSTYYHVLSIDRDVDTLPPSPSDNNPEYVSSLATPGSSLEYARADHVHVIDPAYLENCIADIYAINVPVFLYDGQNGVYIPRGPLDLANAFKSQTKMNFALVIPPNYNSYPVLFSPSKFDTTTGELHLTGIVGGVLYEATLLPGLDPIDNDGIAMVGTMTTTNLALTAWQGGNY